MENSAFSLDGKTLLITGASSGLGACTAIECSKAGAKVIITGRNEDRLNETFSRLYGSGHSKIPFDLCNKEKIVEFCDGILAVDGLSLCAGITRTIPVKYIKETDIDDIFTTNIFASMMIIQTLLKQKKINDGGSIVMISSISAFYADKGNSIYAASKGAINSFARVSALELAAKHIRVNCIQPGFIPTRLLGERVTQEQLEEERKKYPLGFGQPEDVANGMIYLLSDASKWVTGTTLTIDGGVTLR
jgi:NAD(P)-dependent dehydrogenase (short-subunit alcohol dehydrogenase family)